MASPGMTPCPGCGALLPGPALTSDPRANASDACRGVYGEVSGYQLGHIAELGLWHQLLVDTYGAQHTGERTPPIGTAFALIGLYLALEEGRTGLAVRDAHQDLARRYRDWPRFSRAASAGPLTIVDLALAGSPEEHVAILRRWAAEVWRTWTVEHAMVADLIRSRRPTAAAR